MEMGVYKITNTVNEKYYIGSSIDIQKRKSDHRNSLIKNKHVNSHLQNAVNKYGIDNFSFEILELVEKVEELREREQFYIDELNACDRSKGYNIRAYARGGGAFGEDNGWFGKGYLQEGLLNVFYGKTHTEETRKLLSSLAKQRKGTLNPNYGNKSNKNPLSKRIAQVDMKTLAVIKIWDSSIDITRELGFHCGTICGICKIVEKENVRRKCQNFYWCYEKDIEVLKSAKDYISKREKRVYQIDKNTNEIIKEFSSFKEAGDFLGIRLENISRACSGKNQTAGGYKWKYVD